MIVPLIVLGTLTKLSLSTALLYRTSLWWAPSAGLIAAGVVLGFMTQRMAFGAVALGIGVPALYATRLFHQRAVRRF